MLLIVDKNAQGWTLAQDLGRGLWLVPKIFAYRCDSY